MTEDWRRCVVDPALRVLAELNLVLKDRTSLSPLSRAVLLGTPVIELKKYREYGDQVDDQGRTALRLAVEMGSLETVKELLDGLNVNADIHDANGVLPLHAASRRGDGEVVDALLRKTKHPEAVDKSGQTPLVVACKFMNWELVSRLAKVNPVSHADQIGGTALHYMLQNTTSITDCMEAFDCLLTNQAGINLQDNRGRAPIHIAAERGLSDAVLLLHKRGADINISDLLGETPLHKCVSKPGLLQGKTCVLLSLLELKADAQLKRSDGKTAADVVLSMLSSRTWSEPQKIALEVALRRLKKVVEDLQKV
jgi:ankyrin repeat protein